MTGSKDFQTDIMVTFLFSPNGAMMLIFLSIYALCFLALFLQMVFSFCLIAIIYVTGPLAVVTIPNDEYNLFNLWLKTFVARALTLFLQGLCVVLSIRFLTNFDNVLSYSKQPFTFAIAVGFLVLGIVVPSILQQFGNSTGSGRMIISTIRTVAMRRR
jgi:hypothetical protein